MKKHPPYLISHICLDKQLAQPELDLRENGHYLVFWWKEIALGHLFLQPGSPLSPNKYFEKMLNAIRPTIEFYAKEQLPQNGKWQEWLLQQDLGRWTDWMVSVFAAWIPEQVPDTVEVSIIICTRNRAPYLHRCLRMLNTLTCQPTEIIVVDNNPSDTSSHEVVAQFSDITYIKEPRPGLDIARNTGLKHAKSPVVAYLDDDVVVHPLWLFRIWETFQTPAVAAMTGLVFASELNTEAQYMFEKYWSFNRGYVDKIYNSDYFRDTLHQGPPVWEIGAGANMAFRRDVFKEVGYFNELLDVGAAGCNGDSEMWYRILANGRTIRYNPRAIAYHEHRKDMKGLKKQLFYYMRGFVAAVLIQQRQHRQAGYKRHLIKELPIYYAKLLLKGFPNYTLRFKTIGVEIMGMLSGLAYYFKNRNDHHITPR